MLLDKLQEVLFLLLILFVKEASSKACSLVLSRPDMLPYCAPSNSDGILMLCMC